MISKKDFDGLLDIELKIDVDINTIKLPIEEIISFEKGTIIDFQIPAGSSAKVSVNDTQIGEGEIMVYEKNLAVRINDILDSNKLLEVDFFN